MYKITKRNLPHWSIEGATYFVTFRTKRETLSEEEIIEVTNHIKKGNNNFYELFAAVVMPDHVHLLLRPNADYSISRIMKGLKGVSSRKVNNIRKRKGSIWLGESFDRIIRNENEFIEKMNYIMSNPVKKGLATDPIHYPGLYICSR